MASEPEQTRPITYVRADDRSRVVLSKAGVAPGSHYAVHTDPTGRITLTPTQERPDITELDRRLAAAIDTGDDHALTELADDIEHAGLPELANTIRERKTTGLRQLLHDTTEFAAQTVESRP